MKRLAALAIAASLTGCSYGPTAPSPTACSDAHARRQNVPNQLAGGSLAGALAAIDAANAACPDTRKETRGDEVKLLAELARCDDARKLADAIDADRDASDGAWLSASVARARCDADGASKPSPSALALEGRLDVEAGRLPAARRHFDRALAFAAKDGLEIHADCTHWSHNQRFVGAYQPGTNALVVADGDHALVVSADDGRERLELAGHRSPITHVAASADGRWILTASKDDVVLWSTEDGARIFEGAGTGPLAFSADGRRFAFVPGDKSLALGIVGAREVERRVMAAKVTSIALLPDRVAVSLADDSFRVVGADGKERSRIAYTAVRTIVPLGGERYLLAGKLVDPGSPAGMAVGADVVGGGPAHPVVEGLEDVFAADPLGRTVLMMKEVTDGPGGSRSEPALRDVATGKDLPVRSVDRAVVSGQRVFTFDARDDLHVFDAATQKDRVLLPSVSAALGQIAISPDAASLLVTFLGPSARSHWEQLWLGAGVFPLANAARAGLYFEGDDRFLLGEAAGATLLLSARTGALWGRFPSVDRAEDRASVHMSQSGRFVVLQRGRAYFRADLAGELPEAELPRPFRRFDGDRIVIMREGGDDDAWLDPATLRELRHAKAREGTDETPAGRECRDLPVQRDCVEEHGDGKPSPFVYVAADGSKVPFEVYPHTLANHQIADRYLAAAYREGTIVFYGPHGGPVRLFLHPFADGTGGYATTPDGRIELFGDAGKRAVCRMGALSLPFFACEERFGRTGLLASILKTGLLPP